MRLKKKTNTKPVSAPRAAAAKRARSRPESFPVVGIGASAGGLAAFEAFFSGLPAGAGPGMAFVLVQHLAPDHKSILAEILGRCTSLPVFEVRDGMAVKPDCVYIIPPNRDMALINGSLQLFEPAHPAAQRMPIDFFFRSLAEDLGERAVGIVLSGTGSDGALGLRTIKGEGGLALAQSPETAEYDGMPRSAIATGIVDFVMPPAGMQARIKAYAGRAFGQNNPADLPGGSEEDQIKKILILLRSRTGNDFSQYKPNTIVRRIERRMAVQQIESRAAYIKYMQQNPAELDALFDDLLIGVTRFFRDPKEFKALEGIIDAQILGGKQEGCTIRVWVPACSTGEEAYSLAILLAERLEARRPGFSVQIFATDIDRRAIETARAGIYPSGISGDLTTERLQRFFTAEPGGYRINKSIRDMLVFSEQNVIKDPPFSRMDLISCRNLLIYMGAGLQERLLPLFHYALNPGGILFLGTAESIGGCENIFETLNHKAKLFRRKETPGGTHRPAIGRLTPPLPPGEFLPRHIVRGERTRAAALRDLTERAMLNQRGLAGALTGENGDILYLHGRSGRYLEPAPGEGAMNILRMAREGLRGPLATALKAAASKEETVSKTGLRVRTNGDFTYVNLIVQPVKDPTVPAQRLFITILEPAPAPAKRVKEPADVDTRLAALKEDLRLKEEALDSSNEELGYFNEQLLSSNEELQSANEELQSSNEELSTAKEELQSLNEELATVNAEQQAKMADFLQANNDILNLLSSTGICAIFLDNQLRVKRFTPAVTRVINLIPSDLGRPLAHTVSNLAGYNGMLEDVQAVLDTLTPKDIEVQTRAGEWFLLRIRPYRTAENVIEGTTLTFLEISDLKKAQAAMRRLAVVLEDTQDAVLVSDIEGRILAWNPAAARAYGWSEAEALLMNFYDIVPKSLQAETMARRKKLGLDEAIQPYRSRRMHKSGRILDVSVVATAMKDQSGAIYAISTTERVTGK